MAYPVELLTSIADCDALITIATVERGDLDFKKTTVERKQFTSTNTASSIETDLATVQAEITTCEAMLVTLVGPQRDQILDKKVRAEYKLYVLNARKAATGSRAVLQQAYDLACVDQAIAESDLYIAALNTRKAAL